MTKMNILEKLAKPRKVKSATIVKISKYDKNTNFDQVFKSIYFKAEIRMQCLAF